jgi:hypothetical protein
MCQLSRNSGASTSWNPKGLSRPVAGKLFIGYIKKWQYVLNISSREILRWQVNSETAAGNSGIIAEEWYLIAVTSLYVILFCVMTHWFRNTGLLIRLSGQAASLFWCVTFCGLVHAYKYLRAAVSKDIKTASDNMVLEISPTCSNPLICTLGVKLKCYLYVCVVTCLWQMGRILSGVTGCQI